jgi:uncharacterized membrane protein YfcA
VLALAVIFGAVVGLSLGLTGGGGSIIAVPLLVYGLALPPRQAVGVSLAAVGATALVGALHRLRRREVELRTGLMFAAAGVAGAPLGSWLGRRVPESALLAGFGVLMLWVAARMWRKAATRPADAAVVRAPVAARPADDHGPSCRRDPEGRLRLSSRCAMVLLWAGVVTGVLSGLFGVGGGFVIVPALVLFSGMGIHGAVATSLMVIALVSGSGLASYLLAGQTLPTVVTGLFVAGGIVGLALGTGLARRLSPVALQKGFAALVVLIAVFVIVKNLI